MAMSLASEDVDDGMRRQVDLRSPIQCLINRLAVEVRCPATSAEEFSHHVDEFVAVSFTWNPQASTEFPKALKKLSNRSS
jgi:hypothetical protein